jgi:hypothetical protein
MGCSCLVWRKIAVKLVQTLSLTDAYGTGPRGIKAEGGLPVAANGPSAVL